MKPKVKRLSPDELRILHIAWIASATDLLAQALHDRTPTDVDAAVMHAVDLFVNTRIEPAKAVVRGVEYARRRIVLRSVAALCLIANIQ